MTSRYTFSAESISKTYQQAILPHFTSDIPPDVQELRNTVPMELCMNTLLLTSLTNSSVEYARDQIKYSLLKEETQRECIPSAHNIRRTLIAWENRAITSRYRKILRDQLKRMKKSPFFNSTHSKEGVVIAFDTTEVGYFGDKDKYTVHSKGRTVAKLCHAYLSMQIVCPGFRMIVDVEPVFKHNKPISKLIAKMLKRLRKQNIKVKRIYLDRGFYQIEVLKELRKHYSHDILMPAVRTPRVKEAIKQWHQAHGFKAGMLEMKLGQGKQSEDYMLIFSPLDAKKRKSIRKKSNGKAQIHDYYLYFCLIKPPQISSPESMEFVFKRLSYDYRNRWGIETGYRVVKTLWGQTTSKEYSLRLWLMWNAVIIYNLWVLENLDLLQHKGIPSSYHCCEGKSLMSAKVEPLPREAKERPKRPWQPRPIQKLRQFLWVLQDVVFKEVTQLLEAGYCGPEDENFEYEEH